MLVRNNIVCPRCGRLSFTDLFVVSVDAPLSLSHWVVRAECFDCLYATEKRIAIEPLRDWIRFLSDDKDPSRHWAPLRESLSLNQKGSVWRWFQRQLPPGGVSHRTSDWPELQLFIEWVRSPLSDGAVTCGWWIDMRSGLTFSK